MSTTAAKTPANDHRARDDVERLISLSEARPSDRVFIAGPGQLDLCLELCHRGFADVVCAAAGAPRAGEVADVVWLPHAAGRDLEGILARLRGVLRDGGLLVIHDDRPAGRTRLQQVQRLLLACGFLPLAQAADQAGLSVCARKPASGRLIQAA